MGRPGTSCLLLLHQIDYLAVSFAETRADIEEARAFLDKCVPDTLLLICRTVLGF